MTINGKPVELELNFDRYAELPTFERIKRDIAERRGLGGGDGPAGMIHEVAKSVHVEGLGTIYFGEVTARFGRRALTMLRNDLDDRVPGKQPRRARTIVVAGGEGNGSQSIPP